MSTLEIRATEDGFVFGDLEILVGGGGKGKILRANSLVLKGARLIVVDPAACERRHQELTKQDPILFYTHYHADHRAAEWCYPRETEVWVSAPDAEAIRSAEDFARRVDSSDQMFSKQMVTGLRLVYRVSDRPVAREVDDREIIEAGGCRAELFGLPGHTPGHTGFFFPEQSLLYLTDLDLTPFGPWYGNDVSDMTAFKKSVLKAREFQCEWYFSSHLKRILNRAEFEKRIDDFEAHFERRDSVLLEALGGGEKHLNELSRLGVIYKPSQLQRMENLLYFERKQVKMHLEQLVKEGKVLADENFEQFRAA